MASKIEIILIALIICSMGGACEAHSPALIAAEIDSYLSQLAVAGSFSGSVLVAQNGDILVQRGYGFADRENRVPNTPQTRYRIHWVSMPVTAIAILMLQADGSLAVDQKICVYIPDCPGYWQEITIHHLLTHTSGLSERKKPWTDRPATALDRVKLLMHEAPYFNPGDQFRYSNNGYIVLGYIIEVVSKSGYEEFLQQNIFGPLGMTQSG